MAVFNESNKAKWTKDGRHWYFSVYFKNIDGRRKQHISKMFKTKQEAETEELIFLTKRDNPSYVQFTVVANDYFKYIATIRKSSTVNSYVKDYNNHIKPYFERLYINNMNMQAIRFWASEIDKKNISVSYKNKIYNILCGIIDYGIKNYGLNDNCARSFGCFQEKNDKIIKDEEKLRYITYEEYQQFISVIENIEWKTFFTFAYYTGCRRGEIQALTWEDIDFNTNDISINKTLYEEIKGNVTITSTKNNQNRKIKMSKTLKENLLAYKNYCKQYLDYKENWFVFGCTRFLPKTTIDRYKDHYFNISGVKRITMHEFRHSHVSLLINEYIKTSKNKNMKIDTAKFFLMLSNRMGHTIQVMQDTYMHLFPTIQDEIVDLLDNL